MQFNEKCFYHIYNRGNNGQQIFFEDENYYFFLRKIKNYLGKYLDVVAYCLMPNHFHLLVHSKKAEHSPGDSESPGEYSRQVTNSIAVLLRSYTRAINKRYSRTGSLFQQSTKAKLLDTRDKNYPFICFHYIHQNPVKSNLVKGLSEWSYSSFLEYLDESDFTICNREIAYDYLDIPEETISFEKQSKSVRLD